MNMQKKIERYLRVAPKPPASDSLLERLQADISLRDVKTRRSSLHRFFAPTGRSVSPWRVAAAVAITIAVLLPLGYGATKLIRRFAAISQLPTITVDFPESGALSPDGRHFAGITWNTELVVIDTSTGEQRNLGGDSFGGVVWSADGREIAVEKRGGDEEQRGVVAVSLETGETRRLLRDPHFFEDWSHDGKLILSVQRTARTVYSVILSNLDSTERTVLAEDTGRWPSPRFSPRGDRVSYVMEEAGHSVLHLQEVDGTSHTKYSDFAGAITQPIWSPDGSHIVFTGAQRGINAQFKDLWAVQVQGNQFAGVPIPVVPNVEQVEFYNWSRNGQLAYRTGFRLGGIFTMPVDPQTGQATGSPHQLVRRSNLNSYCWSPDGGQVATTQGGEMIFISASSGETIRGLSLSGIENIGRGMSWSPDGRVIAFCGIDNAKRTGVFLITVESGDVRLLVPLEGAIANYDPTWSPDNKAIAYAHKNNVYVVNVEDGTPRKITTPPEERDPNVYVTRPVFSPDGRSVAYIAGQRTRGNQMERILMTTIDGQGTEEIFRKEGRETPINIFDFSPDGCHIVYTRGNKRILCVPTDGGKAFRIGSISNVGKDAWAWMPKWSPKGDAISFIVTCEKYQYWVMEDFLPATEAAGR